MRVLLILVLSLGIIRQVQAQEAQPPGTIYSVNERDMHLYCTGTGDQTVILEAGVGGFSLNWSWVQPEVAKFARVCSYDRPGYGWSTPSSAPFSLKQTVNDLHNLLSAADITPPYLFVGHSFGGVIARVYHDTYPGHITGMILVDAVHPDMPNRVPGYADAIEQQFYSLSLFTRLARLAALEDENSTLPVPTNVPEDVANTYIEKLLEPNFFNASYAEAVYLANDMPDLALPSTIGDMPLVVFSHGIPERRSFLGAPLSAQAAADAEAAWQDMQRELAALSPQGELMIAEDSTHNIQFDEPGLIVDAIREMLAEIA